MLELEELTLGAGRGPDESRLLSGVSAKIPAQHLCAIIGPSGCGKSTLLKVISGIREQDSGAVHWEGRNLAEEKDFEPHEIGYVPQFSIAYDLLTVVESIDTALRLRVGGLNSTDRAGKGARILQDTGLGDIAERRVGVLSGGQKRRLALALELVSAPVLLLCDEVTSGLDPKAEDEIVHLLHHLSREESRTVLSVTHSLRHLELYDSVMVLHEGHLVYHGPPSLIFHYFGLGNPVDLYPNLARRPAEEWHASWEKHRAAYYASFADDYHPVPRFDDEPVEVSGELKPFEGPVVRSTDDFRAPGRLAQFVTLLGRRFHLLFRDGGQVALQIALLFGFPCLVVIFAWDGLPQIQNFNESSNAVQQLIETAEFTLRSSRIAGLVSGLVMFQVILLTLMGSNNGAREIAGERAIFEKEKFAGLRPSSYVASKTVFLALLVLAQSFWMAFFVNSVCRFPGDLFSQVTILLLVNAAMTSICLGLSSVMRSAEQASLVCVYFVGFQLPLSGAVLALPEIIGWLTRPFIAGYWGWSGYLQTMRDSRFYDVVQSVAQTSLSPYELCCWVLGIHVACGLLLAYLGTRNSQWK